MLKQNFSWHTSVITLRINPKPIRNMAKKIAEQLIDKKMISYLGTDCHHMGHINLIKNAVREPYLQKLIESETLLNNTL